MLRYRCTHMIYGLVGKLIEYIDLLSFLNTDIDLLKASLLVSLRLRTLSVESLNF